MTNPLRHLINLVESAERLDENNRAPLYHTTLPDGALGIIHQNRIDARTPHRVSFDPESHWSYRSRAFRPSDVDPVSGEAMGVSLTRSLQFARQWRDGSVILELDANRLRMHHRMIQVDYYMNRNRPGVTGEAEEFVLGPIENVEAYLLAIWIDPRLREDLEAERENDPDYGWDLLLDHPKLKILGA